jgi:mutator protein MutT
VSLYPVALVIFYKWSESLELEVWTQKRTDDGPFHGLLEFPGGGVEHGETPLVAAIREVQEEVDVNLNSSDGRFMGIYNNVVSKGNILLYVFLFPPTPELDTKGEWLKITKINLSAPYKGMIPFPNHQIIDDLYNNFFGNLNYE